MDLLRGIGRNLLLKGASLVPPSHVGVAGIGHLTPICLPSGGEQEGGRRYVEYLP
jgi:hypothetical protein